MKKTAKIIIPSVIVIALVGFMFAGLSSKDNGAVQSPLAGKPVPAFSLTSVWSDTQPLDTSIFNGEVTLLNVWASWCGICKSEHPFLLKLAQQSGLRIIGLNYRDDRQRAIDVLTNTGNPYQEVIFDPKGKLALDLGVIGTPETYLVDQNGTIIISYTGALNEAVWAENFAPRVNQIAAK